jgi:WD40 repeat protein
MSQHPQLLRQQQSSSLSLPSGNYVYSLAACGTTGESLAAISSDDSLRLFDRRTLQTHGGGEGEGDCFADNIHNGGVTCLCDFWDGDCDDSSGGGAGDKNNLLVTGGRDGKVRLWDVRGEGKAVVEFQTGKEIKAFSPWERNISLLCSPLFCSWDVILSPEGPVVVTPVLDTCLLCMKAV